MGGTQSWLSCDDTYPDDDTPRGGDARQDQGGDPIIAVIMFAGTLFGILLLTALAHCGVMAWRGCRSRHRRHRHHHQQYQQQQQQRNVTSVEVEGAHPSASGASAAVADGVQNGDCDSDDNGECSSLSSSSTVTSSDTSLDSTTARIAAQVASRRRSRFLDLTGVQVSAGPRSTLSPSPMPAGFLMPPPPAGAFDNPAYDGRFDTQAPAALY